MIHQQLSGTETSWYTTGGSLLNAVLRIAGRPLDPVWTKAADKWKGETQNPLPTPKPANADTSSAEAMKSWTPEQLAAADRTLWEQWAKNPFPDTATTGGVEQALKDLTNSFATDWRTYALLGGAALALYIAVRTAGKVLL